MLSIDGVEACDHVLRSSFLAKLQQRAQLAGFASVREIRVRSPHDVCVEYGTEVRHQIHEVKGGEQGDPLMPLLFSLGIHNSLCAVDESLIPEDELFAFLDDVHVASPPHRTRGAYNILEE